MAVSDAGGDTGAAGGGIVTVNNAIPAITNVSAPVDPIQLGTPITVTATFTDVGTLDTYTCTFGWGDGSPTTTATATGGSCQATRQYAEPSVYSVTVTVTDDDTGSAATLYEYVVVFDPAGGAITGGGWIMSPAGALRDYPDVVGKAKFGFYAKYRPGISIPTGETDFQFRAGGFIFQANVYRWLVVAGPRAQCRGDGFVNGVPGYKFTLTATDGQAPNGGGVQVPAEDMGPEYWSRHLRQRSRRRRAN